MKSTIYAALITAARILALIGSITWDAAILVAALVAVKAIEIETKQRDEMASREIIAGSVAALLEGLAGLYEVPQWFSQEYAVKNPEPHYSSDPDYLDSLLAWRKRLDRAWREEYARQIITGGNNVADD
ncbi:MAG: hypothetical protein KC496_00450 [Anaerolineae bacterium]|nr:hypothetical protein [Anaerolineae bacterium]